MKFNINFGSISNLGKVKEHNTDAVIEFPIADGHVFAVCDGHDGVEFGGALAAKITTEEIKRYFFDRSYGNLSNALTNAVSYANYCVYNQSNKEEKYNGIGSTLAILIIQNDEAYYASAGNSRIYIHKDGQIAQITRDHIENGEVSVLVGKEKNIKFSVCKNPIQLDGNETFLLCTDGLTNQLSDNEIFEVLNNGDMSSEMKTARLIDMANNAGGADNVSVQVIDFSTMTKKKEPQVSIWRTVAIVSSLLLFIIGFYELYKFKVNEGMPVQPMVEQVATPSPVSEPTNQVQPTENQTKEQPKAANQANTQSETKNTKPEPVSKQVNAVDDNKIHIHVVEKGQNLFRIGLRYNVPYAKIEELNGDAAKNLTIGARLKIPVKAIHKITNGETIESIAAKYGNPASDIIKANQLSDGEQLEVGDELIIPLSKK
ncbi:MAG: LysM peptidoglycan-binding domain-containing protein [Salinivirgaceae bacterium]|nr:LysM peptidoglycan-binding domain-containing protein [Salinivirgaceae bacterium]